MTRSRQAYVNAVVANYVRLPETPPLASRRDRQVAGSLYDRGVPLRTVWAAFVLASARRALRAPQQPPLPPVRTLFYFLPALEEVADSPLDEDYVAYLAAKLRTAIAEKDRQLGRRQASSRSDSRAS